MKVFMPPKQASQKAWTGSDLDLLVASATVTDAYTVLVGFY